MSTRYTKEHEWIRLDGDLAVMGISDHAQEQLGDVVFVDLPEVGLTVGSGDQLAVVESVKAASDVYSPIAGEVVEINEALAENPALVNESAEDGGWFAKVRPSDPAALEKLMDEDAYRAFVAEQA